MNREASRNPEYPSAPNTENSGICQTTSVGHR